MNKVVEKIREEIKDSGPISFERFMELALYCPDYGYYETIEDRIGRKGDYYTSVSVGPVFGQLLAAQFAEWLQNGVSELNLGHPGGRVGNGDEFQIIEAGAHDGQLAKDVLAWLRVQRPELSQRLRYTILEPSPKRRKAQEYMLADFSDRVSWRRDLHELRKIYPPDSLRGIIFGNELLDAMPVRVFRWNAARTLWAEWGVGCDHERFCWVPMAESPAPFSLRSATEPGFGVARLSESLPEGYQMEICEPAIRWWRDAGICLDLGWLLTLDYGFRLEERFSPSRIHGTLRSYRQHCAVQDVLAAPGEQDITAQVDFSGLQLAGEEVGLRSRELICQQRFLTRAATLVWGGSREAWDAKSTRQFQTLTHPCHLGAAFQVLVQTRGLRS